MSKRLLKLKDRISRFLTPERPAPRWARLLPYTTLIALGALLFIVIGAGWEYTNSSVFCGTTCHTMPPQYVSYLASPHARIKCVECHIGRGYLATQFTRKAGDLAHVTRYIGADYETPIFIKSMRPARQICEKCHNPDKFSDDSLREYKHFDAANNNDLAVTYLSFKTGGGSAREGRGKGIHWHVENKVEYIATDNPHLDQVIPWVRVTSAATGEVDEYTDIEADLPAGFVELYQGQIKTMDCTTCHNRVSHTFPNPDAALNDAMARGVISAQIPYFKQNAVAVMDRQYPSLDEAYLAIDGLRTYYAANWSDYYSQNAQLVDTAIDEVWTLYQGMIFPDMEVDWNTHPDNLGHKESAGCFRCHDGKHLNAEKESIRLECNLCHSIPLVTAPDGAIDPLPVAEAFEPETHNDSNWIARHRFDFDDTCQGCHSTDNAGGSDNTSFCANSGCHATEWKYAGLDAPGIVELSNQVAGNLPTYPEADLTWNDLIGPILGARCLACHDGTAGLYLDTYEGVLNGGNMGPAIVPGQADESLLVKLQKNGHPNSLPPRELEWIEQWIDAGAPK